MRCSSAPIFSRISPAHLLTMLEAHRVLGKSERLDLAFRHEHDRLYFLICLDVRNFYQTSKLLEFQIRIDLVIFLFCKGNRAEGSNGRRAGSDARPQDLVERRTLFQHHGSSRDHSVPRADRRIYRHVDALAIIILRPVRDDGTAFSERNEPTRFAPLSKSA